MATFSLRPDLSFEIGRELLLKWLDLSEEEQYIFWDQSNYNDQLALFTICSSPATQLQLLRRHPQRTFDLWHYLNFDVQSVIFLLLTPAEQHLLLEANLYVLPLDTEEFQFWWCFPPKTLLTFFRNQTLQKQVWMLIKPTPTGIALDIWKKLTEEERSKIRPALCEYEDEIITLLEQ